jgi:hypothetical protein
LADVPCTPSSSAIVTATRLLDGDAFASFSMNVS